MRQSKTTSSERIVKDIKRKTRKQYSAEEKVRRILLTACAGKKVLLNYPVRQDHFSKLKCH